MNRSNRYVFVPFCALAQGVRAQTIVRDYPAVVDPVINMLIEHRINIVQMPCPELLFDGFVRQPKRKEAYDSPKNHALYKQVAKVIEAQVAMLQSAGCNVVAIMGIEYSPSCAISSLTAPPPQRFVRGKGFLIEEISALLRESVFSPKFIGIRTRQIDRTLDELESTLLNRRLPPRR